MRFHVNRPEELHVHFQHTPAQLLVLNRLVAMLADGPSVEYLWELLLFDTFLGLIELATAREELSRSIALSVIIRTPCDFCIHVKHVFRGFSAAAAPSGLKAVNARRGPPTDIDICSDGTSGILSIVSREDCTRRHASGHGGGSGERHNERFSLCHSGH